MRVLLSMLVKLCLFVMLNLNMILVWCFEWLLCWLILDCLLVLLF